jgi:hypothetical protein
MKCDMKIVAGICGFKTAVQADSPDDMMVTLDIQTDCEKVAALAQKLADKEIDGYAEIGAGADGVVLTAARETLLGCCAACVVPCGIFKSVQVAARVALPKDISISMEP